jgi:pimeloyl-ACP methyl ester carboxylesterase
MRSSLIGLRDLPLEEIVKESRKRDPGWSEYERLPWARAKQQFDPSLFSRPAINQRPYTEIVPLITSPTLLVTAENGIVSADVAENAERLWRSKKPFRWVRIMGAGHNIRRERFEEFYQAVEGFLEEIGP